MRLAFLALSLALAAPALGEGVLDPAEAAARAADAAAAEQAGLPLPPPSPDDEARLEASREAKSFPRWGLSVEAGFPEGAAVSLVYRPVSQVRLWAGPAWSVIAFGAQAGVTLVPWHLGLSPILSLEGGRYFSPDARFLARNASGVPEEIEPLLKDVSYDYAAAHVGLELGTRDAFALSLRVGLAYVAIDAKGRATSTDASGTTVTFVDPRVRGTLPSVKLGLQLWF
jgi:hypothetical protein